MKTTTPSPPSSSSSSSAGALRWTEARAAPRLQQTLFKFVLIFFYRPPPRFSSSLEPSSVLGCGFTPPFVRLFVCTSSFG